MDRRHFLRTSALAMAFPALNAAQAAAAGRIKITGIKMQNLKIEKELGSFVDYVGRNRSYRVGGGNFCIVETDAGISGIGSGISPAHLAQLNQLMVGRDPFDLELNAERLKAIAFSGPAVEIALWDLIGKIAGQPLYKLWGGGNGVDYVTPYSSHFMLETPKRRGALAASLKARGWRGMKVKAHYATLKDDIALCEEIRNQAGDDFAIMVDANKANLRVPALSPAYVPWDYHRAYQTAKAYEQTNVFWLEEPLPRFQMEQLSKLQASTSINIAGGEENQGLNQFKDYIDRDCYRVLQPEVQITGVLEIRKILVMAEASGRVVCPHLGDGRLGTVCNMHLSGSATNYPRVEMGNEQPVGGYESGFAIFEEPPTIGADGTIKLPEGPGLGMRIREELFAD